MEYEIRNNQDRSRFEAVNEAEVIGLIDYELTDQKIMVVPHTEVDSRYEGKGIAGAMTKALLEYAVAADYKVLPICPYTKTYIDRHPEYQKLL